MSDFNTLLAVKDLMTPSIITALDTISVFEASRILTEKEIGSIVLTDDKGHISGILTLRDIVVKVVAESKNPAAVESGSIMSDEVRTIDCDSSIFEARQLMSDLEVKHLIVVEGNKPIGIVSATTLLGG